MIKYILSILLFSLLGCGRSTTPAKQEGVIKKPVVAKSNLHKPEAKIVASSTHVYLEHNISLHAGESSDSDGNITSYRWIDDNKTVGNSKDLNWTAPKKAGDHNLSLVVTDDTNLSDTTTIKIKVQDNKALLKEIRRIVESGRATYICVGDSTRAKVYFDSDQLFNIVKTKFDMYHAKTKLWARSGHTIQEFNNNNQQYSPKYTDVTNTLEEYSTSEDGRYSIVDISLAINDFWYYHDRNVSDKNISKQIKASLKTAIQHIKSAKPKTTILLTSPNPLYHGAHKTEVYLTPYRELSQELALPFINFYDHVYKDLNDSQQRALYRDINGTLDYTHYNKTGLEKMAQYILKQIFPDNKE